MSFKNSSGETFSEPSNASARKGSVSAFFSIACISLGESSPFLYLIISSESLFILFHANFQISFSILNITLHLVHVVARRRSNFLIAFLLQIKQLHALLLAIHQFFDARFQPRQIFFEFVFGRRMQKEVVFHKLI